MSFKVGDIVKCINEDHHLSILKEGLIYTISETLESSYGEPMVKVNDLRFKLYASRFIAVSNEPVILPTGPGLASRANGGKLRPTLFPVIVYRAVLKVFADGAVKYGDYNWTKGFKYLDNADSLERHLLQWKLGEDLDSETGSPHLAHIIANAAFLLYYHLTGRYKHLDNRLEHEQSTKGEMK